MIRVLIVDDQELFRESLKVVLSVSPGIEVVGAASGVQEALKSAASCRPDVALMDIRMPGMDGVEGTRLFKERYPHIKVVVLTTFDDDEYVFGALKNGASGYLLKGSSVSELSKAIQIVHEGGAMLNPEIASKAIRQFSSMAKGTASLQVDRRGEAELSRGERQMIQAVGRGLSNKEIAGELCLSEGTVRNTISGILSKLDLRDRTQLAIWAVQTGAVNQGMFS
ncbi:response regulator transcription factor [Oscillibacter sp.]|uniref:response regulator transcription factor n=1 Tax=Oscillibacter sp. TaxID=1945593 RepID=UPI002D7F071D|nr:response regulator transcription factor [Oscillibacter sp.]